MKIQLKQVDLSAVSIKDNHLIPLSAPEDRCKARVQRISKLEKLTLTTGVRSDIYLLQGKLIFQDKEYSAGSFFSGGEAVCLQAGLEGALVYVYADSTPSQDKFKVIETDRIYWVNGAVNGMKIAVLPSIQHQLLLVSWRPGTFTHQHNHPHGEEIFVISGELLDERGAYPAGSWIRLYPGSVHEPYSDKGALIMLRNGHLRDLVNSY